MSRFLNKGSQVVVDVLVLSVAYWLAFLFRYGFDIHHQAYKLLFFTWPYVILFQYLVLSLFGVPRFAWRYVSMRDAQWVLIALGASSAVLVGLRLSMVSFGGYSRFVLIPLGVIAMDYVLAVSGIIGVRGLHRTRFEHRVRKSRAQNGDGRRVPTLLIGAGQAGVIVAKEIASRPDLGIKPVGFLDDDQVKRGTRVHGVPVLGRIDEIDRIADRHRVKHALITIANAPGREIRRITNLCRDADLHTKIIPGIYEIVGGDVNLSRIRDVAIEDLLGREPVALDDDAISGNVRDRVVLVSGAGGSIGSELCRQVCRFGPSRLVLVEIGENALFEIHRELLEKFPKIPLVPRIADVCDPRRMERIFADERPAVVFHAAAHKHVPMVEWNACEAVKNNVFGTKNLADLSDKYGVSEFVMISTDKAVNPTSVMGASKRVAEIYIQALSQRSDTLFVAVRFGNVLGSAGSVIPIFKQQIARGGPVTITDAEMRRYFMTIPEASQLVLQAASMGEGGEIFVLDMGEPVKIIDLARDLIELSGFEPDEEIEIQIIGIRPGEKLFEELSVDAEKASKTKHPKIYIGRITPHDWTEVMFGLKNLGEVADRGDISEMQRSLGRMVPEYSRASAAGESAQAVS